MSRRIEDFSTKRDGVPRSVLFATAYLCATSPVATDLYLPALPELARELGVSATGAQLTLTAFLVGIAIGQLIFGPASDRWGRRVPLLVGCTLFCLASFAAAQAGSIEILIAARFIQGAAGAAGVVIGRAVIADLSVGPAAARAISLMMSIAGAAPIVAPVIGGLLAEPIGWRGILLVVFVLSVVGLVIASLAIPETLPRAERQRRRNDRDHSQSALTSLTSRRFVGYAMVAAFGFAALLAYVSASPFIYQEQLGLTPTQFGLVFALNSVVLIAMTYLSSHLVGRMMPSRLLGLGLVVMSVGVGSSTLVLLPAVLPWLLLVSLPVALAGWGLTHGNVVAAAIGAVPTAAGTASAVVGFGQFALGGIAAGVVSTASENQTVSFLLVYAACMLLAIGGFVLGSPRVRSSDASDPRESPASQSLSAAG